MEENKNKQELEVQAQEAAQGAAEEEKEEQIVVITDDDGCESYYREELVLPVEDKNFAILVAFDPEEAGDEADEEEAGAQEEETCSCGCHHHHEAEAGTQEVEAEEDDNIIIARIDTDENGEEVYVGPTDEEFAKVRAAYEALFAEEE